MSETQPTPSTLSRRNFLRSTAVLAGLSIISSVAPSSVDAHNHTHDDCIATGQPNPTINTACPGIWGVDILVNGSYFVGREANNPNEEWDLSKPIWAPIKGGRKFELFLMGTNGSVRDMLAPEDGNGLAEDLTSPQRSKVVSYRQEGIGWDRARLINPNTNREEDLPVVRGQLKRYLETPIGEEKFKSVYEFCLPICPIPEGQKPWTRTIYIMTGLPMAELQRKGISQKEGMNIPEASNLMHLVSRR